MIPSSTCLHHLITPLSSLPYQFFLWWKYGCQQFLGQQTSSRTSERKGLFKKSFLEQGSFFPQGSSKPCLTSYWSGFDWSEMEVCWWGYAWVPCLSLKEKWGRLLPEPIDCGERFGYLKGREAWDGKIHLEKITTMPRMNKIWKSESEPDAAHKVERGEERNEALC